MEWETIISTAMKLHYLTHLNIYVRKEIDGSVFQHQEISIPAFMPGAENHDIQYFYEHITFTDDKLYTYMNEWGLHYLGYTFSKGERYTVIVGPYMELIPDFYRLTMTYNLNNNESKELKSFCNKIQVLGSEKTNSFLSVLAAFDQLARQENIPVRIEAQSSQESKSINRPDRADTDSGEIIKTRYKVEKDLLRAVEQGNKLKALATTHANDGLFSFAERLPQQPLRRFKNLNIILNTLLRTTAGRKKVPAILIHRLSEKYAHEIEKTNQLSKLQSMQDAMIEEYSDLIASHSLSSYSTVVQKAVEHLMIFYDEKIDKEELANLCFIHPNHLSRKFKQETNMTIGEFQQKLRLDEARYLLENEPITVEEAAWLVGYEDASYFTRVFKKETGLTPSQYKEQTR